MRILFLYHRIMRCGCSKLQPSKFAKYLVYGTGLNMITFIIDESFPSSVHHSLSNYSVQACTTDLLFRSAKRRCCISDKSDSDF